MIAPTYHRGDTINYTPIHCHGCQSCEFRCDHVIGYTDADGKPVSIHDAMARIAELEQDKARLNYCLDKVMIEYYDPSLGHSIYLYDREAIDAAMLEAQSPANTGRVKH